MGVRESAVTSPSLMSASIAGIDSSGGSGSSLGLERDDIANLAAEGAEEGRVGHGRSA